MKVVDRNHEPVHFTVARIPSINVDHLDRDFYEELTRVDMLSDDTYLGKRYVLKERVFIRASRATAVFRWTATARV